jgi:hypothetical protein
MTERACIDAVCRCKYRVQSVRYGGTRDWSVLIVYTFAWSVDRGVRLFQTAYNFQCLCLFIGFEINRSASLFPPARICLLRLDEK